MSLQATPSTSKLFLRCLQPSVMGLSVSFAIASLVVFTHLLMLSLSVGTIFAGSDDQILSIAYTNYFVGPMLRFLNLGALGLATTVVIWGFTGWLLFTIAERLAQGFHEWRQLENSNQVTPYQVINHPLRKNFIIRVLWRLGCIIAFIVLLLIARPILDYVMKRNGQLLGGELNGQALISMMIAIVILTFLGYVTIVLLRLYAFRTRLSGEILY